MSMTLMQRATALMGSRGAVVALAAVPIATMVNSADAALLEMLPATTLEARASGGAATTVLIEDFHTEQYPEDNGVIGLKIYGTATYRADTSGTATPYLQFEGPTQGTFTSYSELPTLPVTYDYTIAVTGGVFDSSSLSIGVSKDGTSNALSFSRFLPARTSGHYSGAGDMFLSAGGISGWRASIYMNWKNVELGDLLTITIPQNSIDVNPVPEPSGAAVVFGGALFALRRRRRSSAAVRPA